MDKLMRRVGLRLCSSKSTKKYTTTAGRVSRSSITLAAAAPRSFEGFTSVNGTEEIQAPTAWCCKEAPILTVTDDMQASAIWPRDDVPPLFAEILQELDQRKQDFGGLVNFSTSPCITHKVKQKDFTNTYTDYEYIYLTVLGLAALHQRCEEIIRQNNGQSFTENPGTQMLEYLCGMTMHAHREGSNTLLRTAPATLLEAFAVAKRDRELRTFFMEAFDRGSDPCLEGRVGKLMSFLEERMARTEVGAPWDDMSLQHLPPSATGLDIIGEHLRVFMNECTWVWCRETGLTYNAAKKEREQESKALDFRRLYNAVRFEQVLLARGVVQHADAVEWEVMTESGEWKKYDTAAQAQIQAALQQGLSKLKLKMGPRRWTYEINLESGTQKNPKTGMERPIRSMPVSDRQPGMVSQEDMKTAIAFFVEMDTLPSAP